MASFQRRALLAKGGIVYTLVIILMCSGLTVCDKEVMPVDARDSSADVTEEPPLDTEEVESPVFEINPSNLTKSGTLDDSYSKSTQAVESEEAITDQASEGDVENESEAPQIEAATSTENNVEATSVSSQKPKPEPTSANEDEERGDFTVRNEAGEICLRACFIASFVIDYASETEDSQVVNRTTQVYVPAEARAGGRCGRGDNKQSVLRLDWGTGNKYSLTIIFHRVNASKKGDPNFWEAQALQFTFDTRDSSYFDAATNAGFKMVYSDPSESFFPTPFGDSRVCDSEDNINMLPIINRTEKVTMEISKLQIQPYGLVNGTFGKGTDCGEDLLENPSTNVASIAVGATLACLILVVIIVYAVGRKMGAINDRSGYKSVE